MCIAHSTSHILLVARKIHRESIQKGPVYPSLDLTFVGSPTFNTSAQSRGANNWKDKRIFNGHAAFSVQTAVSLTLALRVKAIKIKGRRETGLEHGLGSTVTKLASADGKTVL